ncbi:MAG TPA: glucose-6-phosphate isomerase, partial [Bacteroidales bacterium]|nr:glucose-6-phosphate isomerase [Bacteroidales bacterium]
MNKFINIDINNVLNFISKEEINSLQPHIDNNHKALLEKTNIGNDFLGWVNLPSDISNLLVNDIIETSKELAKKSKIIIVIGIGGSYLGAKAVIDALTDYSPFINNNDDSMPKILFAGNNLCSDYHYNLLKILDKYDYSVIVISKSGTTTEPAIAFRLIRRHLIKKYGHEEAKHRIIAVTDREKGALKKLSIKEGYQTFVIPDDIGGRFSVLSPVGLLPIACTGFDITKLLNGAQTMQNELIKTSDINKNIAAMYAACRYSLYRKGMPVEVMACYHPSLAGIIEWWKQLFGESEGKQHRGIFPTGVNFTTDLHSLGQYIQDGMRILFETVVSVANTKHEIIIPEEECSYDGISFTAGKTMQEINYMAMLGTAIAHVDGGVPVMVISVPTINEYYLGQLIYMFEFACGLSGY